MWWALKVPANMWTKSCGWQYVGLSPVVGDNPLVIKMTEPDSSLRPVCYLTRSQAGRTEVMAGAGVSN